MADELLERVRAAYGAWNEGDLDQTLSFLAEDVEWHTSASFPGMQPLYEGHEGFRRFWKALHDPFDNVLVELESYEREGEIAIIRIRFHGTSRDSGVEIDLPWFQAIVIENEMITRSALDRTVGDALDALDIGDLWAEF